MINQNLQQRKKEALETYKAAKTAYLKNMSNKNWIAFCDAETNCMRLGVRI